MVSNAPSCPICLTALPSGARRCRECGARFSGGGAQSARWLGFAFLLVVAVSLGWWLRARATPSPAERPAPDDAASRRDLPRDPPLAPPEAPVRPVSPVESPPPDATAAASAADAADAAERAARATLAAAAFFVAAEDRAGVPLAHVVAVRTAGVTLFSFAALNGAARLHAGADDLGVDSIDGHDGERRDAAGRALAFSTTLADHHAESPLAPAGGLEEGAQLFALVADHERIVVRSVGRVVQPPAADGTFVLTIGRPLVACFLADADGRLAAFALDSTATPKATEITAVALEPALAACRLARPAGLTQLDALYFECDGRSRALRATWYAASDHYAAALSNYLAALRYEPALYDEVKRSAAACAPLALRAAREREEVAALIPLLEEAATRFDREPWILHACGLALLDEGSAEEALRYLADAVNISGQAQGPLVDALRAAYVHAGEAARADHRPDRAIELLEDGLRRYREEPALLESLGYAYYELGDRDRARIVLTTAASLDARVAQRLQALLADLAPSPVASDAPLVEIHFDRASGAIRTSASFADKVDAGVIIDTGATITAISESLADRLKLDRKHPLRRIEVGTANGRIEAPVVALDSIDVQGARVTHVEVVVLPLSDGGGGEALIGLDFLEHFALSLDAAHGVLRLAAKQ